MLVRLKESGGFVQIAGMNADPIGASLEKRALICYAGKFNSMDGPVEVTEEDLRRIEKNHNGMLMQVLSTIGLSEVPLKHCPPLQVDHSTSAHNTVGRLIGKVETGSHIMHDGEETLGLYGHVRVLGKDNVEKVVDGRWIHLSIGADFEEGKISELTITPFPAAGEASLLAKYVGDQVVDADYMGEEYEVVELENGKFRWSAVGKQDTVDSKERAVIAAKRAIEQHKAKSKLSKGDTNMFKKLMAFLTKGQKLSEKDATEKLAQMSDEDKSKLSAEADTEEGKEAKLKEYLKRSKSLSDDDVVKHMAEMDEEMRSKLAAECDADEKKLADEKAAQDAKLAAEKEEEDKKLAAKKLEDDEKAKTEDEKKLSAAREGMTRLSSDFRTSTQHAMLTAKKGKISVRLSKLKADCKITPAEIKKIDIAKLAEGSDATIDAVLASYTEREPVINIGALGSTKSTDLSKFAKEVRMTRLEAETRANMPMKNKELMADAAKKGVKLSSAMPKIDSTVVIEELPSDESYLAEYGEIEKLMDEGKTSEAKVRLKKWMGRAPATTETGPETETHMNELAETVKKMQTQFEEYSQVSGALTGITTLVSK